MTRSSFAVGAFWLVVGVVIILVANRDCLDGIVEAAWGMPLQ